MDRRFDRYIVDGNKHRLVGLYQVQDGCYPRGSRIWSGWLCSTGTNQHRYVYGQSKEKVNTLNFYQIFSYWLVTKYHVVYTYNQNTGTPASRTPWVPNSNLTGLSNGWIFSGSPYHCEGWGSVTWRFASWASNNLSRSGRAELEPHRSFISRAIYRKNSDQTGHNYVYGLTPYQFIVFTNGMIWYTPATTPLRDPRPYSVMQRMVLLRLCMWWKIVRRT